LKQAWISIPKYSGYAVGYGMETIIGPAEIKYTWSPELAKGFTWFSIGFYFKLKLIQKIITIFVIMKANWTGLLAHLQFLIKRNPE
jgi:hypothetical protein